ncbi:MAG: hypothetical protein CMM01_15655 [Rhodopirellula sp.]|nr:hypothetical protein [Rhodopirellula sp.]
MNVATESFQIAFRVSDKRFVIRDAHDNDVFSGNYAEVESWLDEHENTGSQLRETKSPDDSESNAATAILKATMLTQEMLDKALATDIAPEAKQGMKPKTRFSNLRRRLFAGK